MWGVILAGGLGTRMGDCTKVTNKHLLSVYDKPMIYYPISTMTSAGIENIIIITGPESSGDFLKLLGDGRDFGADFTYKVQKESKGIAHAVNLTKRIVGTESIAVILGDNYFSDIRNELSGIVKSFKHGAEIFLKSVDDPERFGVPVFCCENEIRRIVRIEEKPKEPKSNFAVTGLYLYDNDVFDIIKNLQPSARGEYEITDVNNIYLSEGRLSYNMIKGEWSDMGTPDSLRKVANIVYEIKNKNSERR